MNFRRHLRYHLVRLLQCSYAEADQLIREKRVQVKGELVSDSYSQVELEEEIRLDGLVIRPGKVFFYLLWYKPTGVECTHQVQVPNNLLSALPAEFHTCFPLGRLDLNSEGLLLLTNDGAAYKRWMNPDAGVEKEYEVWTREPVTMELKTAFEQPFRLGPRLTLPAEFTQTGDFSFRVILKEGINRQIRRICAKNQNQVLRLKRIRFGPFFLGDLAAGEFRSLERF